MNETSMTEQDVAERCQQKWPWDFDQLHKGDSISAIELVKASGKVKDTAEYGWYLLHLGQAIMMHNQKKGEPLVVAIVKGALVLLSNREAAEYTENYFRGYLRRLRCKHAQQLQVDDSDFTETERQIHRRRLVINGRTIQGASLGRRNKLVLQPVERKTPGLPG